jgi:hypothetical protein
MRHSASIMFLVLAATIGPAQAQTLPPDGTASTVPRKRSGEGSSPPIEDQTLGVRTRAKPDGSATRPDSSYQTITSEPRSGNLQRSSRPDQVTAPVTNGRQPSAKPLASDKNPLPESLRIQQAADRANPPGPDLITPGGTSGTGGTPTNSSSERTRVDPSAPSRQRLQVDDLTSQQPNTSGTSSMNGSSPGVSGRGLGGSPPATAIPAAVPSASASHSAPASSSHGSSH